MEEPSPELSDGLFREDFWYFSFVAVHSGLTITQHRLPTTIFVQRATH
ncbi:unnamed protein product [Anisakis simplex]|uniref:Uncharacterized protein n=1 Tax=Anisakis simplex TaxID=6269 RepID=A0A3P6SE16_ANISI|nr:unnamed protein product [Anisakis simplex]